MHEKCMKMFKNNNNESFEVEALCASITPCRVVTALYLRTRRDLIKLFDDEIVYRETLMIANGPYKPLSSQINGKKSIAHLVAFIDFVDWYSV